MTPLARIVAFVLIAATPALASAQEAAELPSIVRLDRGERAPHDGLLAPESLFVDWRSRITLLEERLRLDAAAAEQRAAVSSRLCEQRLELAADRLELVDSLWRDRAAELSSALADASRESVLDSPILWYMLGVATVVVLGIAAGVLGFVLSQ